MEYKKITLMTMNALRKRRDSALFRWIECALNNDPPSHKAAKLARLGKEWKTYEDLYAAANDYPMAKIEVKKRKEASDGYPT